MPPYFFPINKTTINHRRESKQKHQGPHTENRTSHYGHYYGREKAYGITCKIHCHLRMHTTKLAKENRSSFVTHSLAVRVVRNALPFTPGRGGRSSDPNSDISAAIRKDFAGILLSLYYSFLYKKEENQQNRRSRRVQNITTITSG